MFPKNRICNFAQKMRVIAFCPKCKTLVLKEVLPYEILCLHDADYTDSSEEDRWMELKEIFEFLKNLNYGIVEFEELFGSKKELVSLKDSEVYNNIGFLEIHNNNMNIIIDFKHNNAYKYVYTSKNEIRRAVDIDIQSIFIH